MIEQNRKLVIFEILALVGVLLLSIVGVGITDVSPVKSYYYWMVLTLLFGIASVLLVWFKQKAKNEERTSLALSAQIIHWVGTLFAVIVVFSLLKSGRLNYESTGLIMMLILGLSIFLDGYHMNWRFTLVGFFIMISTILVAYVEAYMWIVSLVALVVTLVLLWSKKKYQQ